VDGYGDGGKFGQGVDSEGCEVGEDVVGGHGGSRASEVGAGFEGDEEAVVGGHGDGMGWCVWVAWMLALLGIESCSLTGYSEALLVFW